VRSKFRWLREFFVEHGQLKLLAVVLAALSFYAIRGATSDEDAFEIPVEVKVERGIAILSQNPRTVIVTMRGSKEDLRQLDRKEIKAVVRAKAGQTHGSKAMVSISPGNIEGVSRARVIKIRPGLVSLTFDREARKRLKVDEPKTIGVPLIGKVEIDYEPKSVLIHGSELGLRDKDIVTAEPIDVDGRVQSFTKRVKVLPPGDTWVSEIHPSEISVQVNIVTESVTREWSDVTVLAVLKPGAEAEVYFEPDSVSVSVEGHANVVEGISGDAVKVFVDCSALVASGSYELPVNVHLAAETHVNTTIIPETVRVMFQGR